MDKLVIIIIVAVVVIALYLIVLAAVGGVGWKLLKNKKEDQSKTPLLSDDAKLGNYVMVLAQEYKICSLKLKRLGNEPIHFKENYDKAQELLSDYESYEDRLEKYNALKDYLIHNVRTITDKEEDNDYDKIYRETENSMMDGDPEYGYVTELYATRKKKHHHHHHHDS